MQKTTFPVQVLIHDDASTDRTQEIVKEYAVKYPNIVKFYFQKENCYTKPNKMEKRIPFYNMTKGKYIALCEGDDYWTDPYKLQKQVDLLEANHDIATVTHDTKVFSEYTKKFINKSPIYPYTGIIPDKWIVERKSGALPTASIVFRTKCARTYFDSYSDFPVGDYYLMIYNLLYGKVYHFNEKMSVYRLHDESWSDKKKTAQFYITIHNGHQNATSKYNELTKGKYKNELKIFMQKKTYELYSKLIKIGLVKNYFVNRNYLINNFKLLDNKAYCKLMILFLKVQIKSILGKEI